VSPVPVGQDENLERSRGYRRGHGAETVAVTGGMRAA
jgi:hypothetical protein